MDFLIDDTCRDPASRREYSLSGNLISTACFIILLVTSLFILISKNWRFTIIALVIQYVGVFGLVSLIWPLTLAAVKLIVGWMVCSIFSTARIQELRDEENAEELSGNLFKIISASLIWVFVFILAPELVKLIGIPIDIARGSLLLIGIGFIQIGMNRDPMKIIIGLLTILAGFEILYAFLEASILVTGLLALVNLGIAFIGSIILTIPNAEESI